MSDEQAIKNALDQWLTGLDSGDLETMIETCDPHAVVCNQNQPTTVGLQPIRDKYGPRIDRASFKSGFELQHIQIFGDIALLAGRFSVQATDKASGQTSSGAGRLVLGYRRNPDGAWKMVLDVDNNDDTDGVAQ
ncbi:MAG: DUF4440 domain-containing protein [Pseudomonadota bacterium]